MECLLVSLVLRIASDKRLEYFQHIKNTLYTFFDVTLSLASQVAGYN